VRRPGFDLSGLPRHWLAGSALATSAGNAGHVFIPLGEQFFIDTVRQFRDRLDDPGLVAAVNAFIGQEAVHRRAHEALWERLRADGVPVERFGRVIASIRSLEACLPGSFRLAVTAALEHYTAAFGSAFLTEDLGDAVPADMARLLAWHGMEELEHRAVAFDVLRAVDDRYAVRLAGFAFASLLLVVVPATGTVMFAIADRRTRRRDDPVGEPGRGDEPRSSAAALMSMSARFAARMGGHVAAYLRPGFHPDQMAEPERMRVWELEFAAAASGQKTV
jgi:predicted metal-dependent hydrolase